MDKKHDIFISYSRHDTNVVNEFVDRLEREGFSVWIDRDGIESGFKRIILQAIKDCAVVLFFSSQHSNQSGWTAKEIGVAVKYPKTIIPILLDDSNFNEEVEFDLINLDFIDYQDASLRGMMMDRLVKSLKAKIPNPIGQKKAEETRMKAETVERERLEQERRKKADAERKVLQSTSVPQIPHGDTPAPQKKKTLWIAFVAVVVVALVVVLARPKSELSSNEEPVAEAVAVYGSANGHEWVDLSLSSGTKWATCNIGASRLEDFGNYYAWGETKPQTSNTYSWSSYKYANGDYYKLTKYCNDSDYGNNGFTDNLTTLQGSDDPATANWGSGWHTPDKAQWDELLDNTTNQWTAQNGVEGRLFTSKKNGQTLFLPFAGSRWGSGLSYAGSVGYYWSRSLCIDSSVGPLLAWALNFGSDSCDMDGVFCRYGGLSVRPVRQN